VIVNVSWTAERPEATDADTAVVGLFEGEEPRAGADGQVDGGVPSPVAELVASGEAQRSFKSLALTHADGKRWLTVGLGARKDFTPERARVAAALVRERAREISARVLCWEVPAAGRDQADGAGGDDARSAAVAGALVEGTILADYSFDLYKSAPAGDAGTDADADAKPKHLDALIVSGGGPIESAVADAAIVAAAVNAARDLQNRPGNDLTPTALANYALALAEEIDGLQVEVEGRAGIAGLGMGAFAAVAQGSEQEPALIVLRYESSNGKEGPPTPLLAFVGKAVTFDSGGISLKPGPKMAEMKFDMSGGAAVIEAIAAIARLQLPVRLVAVVGATENLPDGRAVKPGDIVTAKNGKTIEINNTDAEGRLVLADCLCHAVSQGAERIVDLATLTGAVIIALGSTYAGIMSNDEQLTEQLTSAGERTGEILWRLPLHPEYDELVAGKYADLDNAPEARKAGTIMGASFLQNFVGETPWAHLDIAGSAWDLDRAYVGKGASGYGVRLLVELARSYGAE
jgi:leucyl aminopeptidase